MEAKKVGIKFGAFCESIKMQLDNHGFGYSNKRVKVFEKCKDSIHLLRFSGLISDAGANKLFRNLHVKIIKHLNEWGGDYGS